MIKFLFLCFSFLLTLTLSAEEWRSFRGPTGMGITMQNMPSKWSPQSILWKYKLPGEGQSSLVEAGNKIFLTTSHKEGSVRQLLCIDADKPALLWERTIRYSGGESSHRMNGWGTPTPATSANRVVAFFGPAGMHCFDLNGNKIWELSIGDFPGNWGAAASPLIRNGIVYQNCDSMGPSRLLAISLETGKIIWDTPRVEKPRGGWSTPIFIDTNEKSQIVLNGEYGVRGYSPADGREIWFCKGFNGRGSPIPFFGNGLVYVVNGKPGDLYAVDPSGKGDVTKSHLRWHARRNGGRDLPSPAMMKNLVLVTSMSGVITCYDSKSGNINWVDRIKGAFSGSPLVTKEHYFIQNESGQTFVIHPRKEKLDVIAVNSLTANSDEIFRATLSPIRGKLYTRSNSQLYCFKGM